MRDPEPMDETIRSPRSRRRRSAGGGGANWSEIPPRVWAFALVAAILLFALFGFWALYLFRGSFGAQGPTPTAIIWTPTPTATPIATLTPTPTEATDEDGDGDGEGAATPTVSPDIAIGRYVQVSGTGGYGLSLREGPGANYTRVDVAAEGEVFIVVEGPHTTAGSPWWRIRDPENEQRVWWVVGNYLEPVEQP